MLNGAQNYEPCSYPGFSENLVLERTVHRLDQSAHLVNSVSQE